MKKISEVSRLTDNPHLNLYHFKRHKPGWKTVELLYRFQGEKYGTAEIKDKAQ